ncbi:DNA polymerase zeta catalytic subunit isoform X5 [Beta vulgaris subsp. vulgaris]|uniref:DNA polymerase zeta catalytic subunit isoform X5 n=1 Tax=Beta vulgaris subsp. vulgaris TaxID=3555 RepID=UPI000540315F|nr:DNA polymerase zeta catalytic subunit isoform X5 [Beta vulgaris subsp. vulgaris]
MEEVSQEDSKVFSVRIVSIDYYMAPPIPDISISYSSFQGGSVKEVPVIRIFGATPGGQKACVHVHRALPYLYVPCSDIPLQFNSEGIINENAISLAVEKALKLKGNAGSKRQHVHGCTLVRAKKFYGYHSSEELFVKIYLYYPHDVSRAANLLLSGAVFEKRLQPYESHIPFLLQFMVDYNLYGMGLMHLVKMKFRHPVPDLFAEKADHFSPEGYLCKSSDPQADATASLHPFPLAWRSSTIPDEWMWQHPSVHGASSSHVKRQSTCELEGDTTIEDILNQQLKMYTSLSQTRSDVRMVQSLVPIWEEEFERSGVHEAEILADPGRPSPQDVLRTMSNGVEHVDNLKGLYSKEESSLFATSEDVKSMVSTQCPIEEGSLVGIGNQSSNGLELRSAEDINIVNYMVPQNPEPTDTVSALPGDAEELDEVDICQVTEGVDGKGADLEDVALLKWLASSQAVEDINSDDELHRETILSPMLPEPIDKVLEKANADYENESQQECQDILDSIVDVLNSDVKKATTSSTGRESSDTKIPQMDGAGDEQQLTPAANSPENMGTELVSTEHHSFPHCSSSFNNKQKRHKSQWGSLPFPEVQQSTRDIDSDPSTKNADKSSYCAVDSRTLRSCSVRDLMRKKRCFRVESSEPGYREVEEGSAKGRDAFQPKKLEFHLEPSEEENFQAVEFSTSSHVQIGERTEACRVRQSASTHDSGVKEKQDYVNSSVICKEEPDVGMPEIERSHPANRSEKLTNKTLLKSTDYDDMIVDELRQNVPGPARCLDSCEAREKTEICVEGDFAGEFGDSPGICAQLVSNKVSENVEGIDCPADPQYAKVGCLEQYACSSVGPASAFSRMEEKGPTRYISMTFHKKPPIASWKDFTFQNSAPIPAHSHRCSLKDDIDEEGTSVQSGSPEDVHPFFTDSCVDVLEKPLGYVDFCQDALMGVPTHYQNDGSCAYLLTPAVSPPSTDSVLKWLALEEKEHVRAKPSPDSSNLSPLGAMSDGLDGENHRNIDIEGGQNNEKLAPCLDEGSPMNENKLTKLSQEISQISGPSGQSKPTPLSQIGFKDPASVGAGQQLTLLSIEVQAESRGDLRPDPQHDTINIIAIAVQNDSCPSVDIYVLLRGATKDCGRNLDGITRCRMLVYPEERELLGKFISIICSFDPDILMGWDIQGSSLGYLAERASHLGVSLVNKISRIPAQTKAVEKNLNIYDQKNADEVSTDSLVSDTVPHDNSIIEDEWGRTHASGVHVTGRIVLNVWRLARNEVKLNMYSLEAVAEAVLRRKIPSIHWKMLNKWFSSGPGKARFRCIEYLVERAKLNIDIVNQLDMINRTSELARVFGIDFFSVLSRGSQYRVESMLVRLAHTQNYVLISPGHQQVASQPAMECIPLVMEPESGFYSDPVVVLDFQSLYPSMIIAYNLCFSTCLGNVVRAKADILGVTSYSPDLHILEDLNLQILITPNGVMYVPSKVRKGVLPRLLEEILSTRVMVKEAMKTLTPSQQILQRIFNARQLALKLIANVTYGYTAAGFSGRMPCAELADSIVQCGRRTLEHAISFVNTHDQWNGRVIYGDTDRLELIYNANGPESSLEGCQFKILFLQKRSGWAPTAHGLHHHCLQQQLLLLKQ